jgi:hypothetical protein
MTIKTLLAMFTWLLAVAHVCADSPVNPQPRAARTSLIHEWTFDQGTAGWAAQNDCELNVEDGNLRIQSTGEDPYFHCPVDLPGGDVEIELRIRSTTKGSGSVFWTSQQTPQRGEDKRADFHLQQDGKWHTTTTRFKALGKLTDLRIDPGGQPGEAEIDWIRLNSVQHHPLALEAVEQRDDIVRFQVQVDPSCLTKDQQAEGAVHFEVVNDRGDAMTATMTFPPQALNENVSTWLEQPITGTRQVEPVSVTLKYQDWPPLERTVWVYNPGAPAEWIRRSLGDYMLLVARDGTTARVLRGQQLVTQLGPLVLCGKTIPHLQLVEDDSTLRFDGDGVRLSLGTVNNEVEIEIESTKPCEGPIVRVQGGLEQGLFAGLEYLGKGEKSSSTLDIETDEHIRFEPDPLKVTMPLMAFVTDTVSVGMTWQNMALQPVYATPNFFDGTPDHRMSLKGTKIKATLRFDQQPLEEAILWAVQQKGLPDLPPRPRTPEQQRELCLAALNGPLRTDQGWGHCVEERWQRRPYADPASTFWRLTGSVPDFPEYVLGGAHVPNDTIYFVTGQAQKWLELRKLQMNGLIAGQKSDGSYRYNGKYRRGHFEDTASGVCARPAANLLEIAYLTGDRRALQAGIKTLDFMTRFRTPRGAQVWECALHTPDQLASAYAVWAFVRGYELTGEQRYLQEARKWALSGIPFTYLWGQYPVMCYATPPVYGATHWLRPNWMGLPVQWVGGVYAYALTLLAPHETTLDWNHLARGILICAQQQQYPDGPNVGLLPDSFNLIFQRRQPANINPSALVSLEYRLDGKVDCLAVAMADGHRVAAPFPVEIRGNQVHVKGAEGVRYQVLIDGTRIVNVDSQGDDLVRLD